VNLTVVQILIIYITGILKKNVALSDAYRRHHAFQINIDIPGVRPCGRVIVAMAAEDVTNVNFGFKDFATAVGIYAATNPL